jgi:hypothetical protein
MADTVETLGLGQRQAQDLFGWGRDTIRKALHERRTGLTCQDATSRRGRKPVEFHLPRLLSDIKDIVADHVQTDPTFQTPRLFCRLSAPEVRRQLIKRKGYTHEQLPSIQTITTKLNALGFSLRKVQKRRAKKKIAQTDAIFEELKQVHADGATANDTLRLSLDAKATVKIGPFSRGGKSRTGNQGADHDFKPTGQLTPFGIFVPEYDQLDLYFTHAKVSSDFMVDMLDEWWGRNKGRFPHVRRLIVDLDNGPENHSHRSQFMYRMVKFAQERQLTVQLAYYPPYHSKYNPIERCWGILEDYWRGEILDSEAAVLGFAANMTYNGNHPHVHRVVKEYVKGVTRRKAQMKALEKLMDRLPGLEKWFVQILPPSPDQAIP